LSKIHLYQQDDHAISQLFAPFGSFSSSAGVSKNTAEMYVSCILKTLNGYSFRGIKIYHPAPCYRVSSIWEDILTEYGFSVKQQLNHHLVIDGTPLVEKMHSMEQRKLSKCRHFKFMIEPLASMPRIYDFIKRCRKEREQSLSMSLERLEQVVYNAPDNFVLCTVYSGKVLAAAAIVIKVNSSCWYQFYPAHSRQFDRESPLVFLISNLYEYAAAHGVKALDLGPSDLNGSPLHGLIRFKSRLGAAISYKKCFTKSIIIS
jgi:hypothetical protein